MSDFCEWTEDYNGCWETDCGKAFEFSAEGPTENEFKFCCYCGKKLISNYYEGER
jgi:hypothetical protein